VVDVLLVSCSVKDNEINKQIHSSRFSIHGDDLLACHHKYFEYFLDSREIIENFVCLRIYNMIM